MARLHEQFDIPLLCFTGVVSTLMLGIGFQSFSSEVPNPNGTEWFGVDASKIIAMLNYASVLAGFLSIMAIILLTMGLNTLPVELTGEFVSQFSLILSVPEIMCMSCLLIYMITSACLGTLLYGPIFYYADAALLLCFLFSMAYLFSLPLLLDRQGGLWEKARKINDDAARVAVLQNSGNCGAMLKGAEEMVTDICI